MKTYKNHLLVKLFLSIILMLILALSLYGIGDKDAPLVIRLFSSIAIVFCPIIFLQIIKLKVLLYSEKIEVKGIKFIPGIGALNWNDVAEIKSEYFLFPEAGTVSLIPRPEADKRFIRFPIAGMPIELIRDILAHIPKDAKIHLYPYLKRRAEGKQIIFYKK